MNEFVPRCGARWPLVLLALSFLGAAAAAQEPPFPRTYDLRWLAIAEPNLAPVWRRTPTDGDASASVEAVGDPHGSVDVRWLVNFLQQRLGAGFDDGLRGSRLELFDPGVLLATADAATHERLAALLAQCRAFFAEQVVAEVHLLPGTALSGGNGLLRAADAERVLGDAGAHPMFVGTATVGVPLLLQANRDQRYLRDYDTEVAQASQIPDPKIDVLRFGDGFRLVFEHGLDGRLFATVLGATSRPESDPVVRPLRTVDQKGLHETSLVQLPRVAVQEQATQALLGDGDALLFGPSSGPNGAPAAVWCVRVRRPHAAPAPAGEDWAVLPLADLLARFRPQSTRHRWLALPGPREDDPTERSFVEDREDVRARWLDAGNLAAILRQSLQGEVHRSLQLDGTLLSVAAPPAELAALRTRLDQLAVDCQRQVSVELRWGRLDAKATATWLDARADIGELAGRLPDACLAASIVDGWFGISVGREQSIVRDFEVEIAQEANTPNPIIEPLFTGFAVNGRVLPVDAASYRLQVQFGFAELDGDVQTFDLKNERFGDIDLPRVRNLTFRMAPIVADNRWTLLQIAALPGIDQHLVLVGRVRSQSGR